MTLGTFTPRARVAGDKIDLRDSRFYGRPYLIQAVDYSDSYSSKMNEGGGTKLIEAVWADVLDVMTGTPLIHVRFTNGNIVDNLKEKIGTGVVLPVKIVKQQGGNFGGYAVLAELDPNEMAAAQNAYNNWGIVAQERARREQAAQAAAANTAPQQASPFGGQQQTPAFQNQPPAQGQGFGQPQFQQQAPAQGGAFGGQPPMQGNGFNQAPQGQPFQGAQSAGAFQAQGMDPAQAQQAVSAQYQQAPAQGQFQQQGAAFGQPMQDPNAGQFQQQAPSQGFGQPNQGFGQPNQGQFQQQAPAQGQPAFGQAPQGAFGQPPVQGQAPDAAAQQALNQLNSGNFS